MKTITMNLDSSDVALFYTEEIIEGENLATRIDINLTPEFQGYRYLILFQNNENAVIPTEELTAVNNVVSYVLTNAITKDAGILKLELQAFDDKGLLLKTATRQLRIIENMYGEIDVVPDIYVPWYVKAVEAATTATEQATIATNKALEASTKLDEVIITNTQLASNISAGNILKTNLSSDITTGNTLKTQLADNISSGNTLKTNLTNSITVANSTKTNLESTITNANTAKTNLDASLQIAQNLVIDGGTF